MDGHRALIYSRIRENRLNPSESDLTRGERQQQVMQALLSKLASSGTFFRLPFIGGDLLKPITTDLTTNQFLQLGWIKFRASAGSTLHCRLGGTATDIGGNDSRSGPYSRLVIWRVPPRSFLVATGKALSSSSTWWQRCCRATAPW